MKHKQLSAAIVGGSLGGLFAGVALKQAGWRVQVYERSQETLADKGAGLRTQPDMIRRLRGAGIQVDGGTVAPRRQRYLGPGNRIVYEESTELVFSSWNALYRMLRQSIGDDDYLTGRCVELLEQDAGAVSIGFEGGGQVTADLVVAADGLSSTLRRWISPATAPRYAGYVCWRGMIPESELSQAARDMFVDSLTYVLLPHGHMSIYFVPGKDASTKPGERSLNFVWYRNVDEDGLRKLMVDRHGVQRGWSMPAGFVKDEDLVTLRAAAQVELPPAAAEIVMQTREPFIQVIVDVEVDRMVAGRACILGDAAFGGRPHLAAGTAKAAADGWALAAALSECESMDKALKTWETRQLAIGRRYVQANRNLGRDLQFLGNIPPEKFSSRSAWAGVVDAALQDIGAAS